MFKGGRRGGGGGGGGPHNPHPGVGSWSSANNGVSPYSVPANIDCVLVVATGGVVISLPDATTSSGRQIIIKDSGLANAGNVIIIDAPVAQQIDGQFNSVSITNPLVSSTFWSNGTVWNIT